MRIVLLGLLLAFRLCAAPAPDFTVVALPDTQFYTSEFPAIFRAQVDWIIANRTNLNIVYVAHLGDITDQPERNPAEWNIATNCLYRLLDAGLPLGVVPGNHDHYDRGVLYDACVGLSVFTNRPWYGGHFGTDNRNHYDLFRVGDLDFVALYLDYTLGPTNSRPADTWADAVLKSNVNRRAIIVSHDILSSTGEFSQRGQAIYGHLQTNTNVFLMLCGHNDGDAVRADTFSGHTIFSSLSDYQTLPSGGDGFLRLYRFSPSNNVIRVQTYSPTRNQYRTNSTAQFTIPYRMNADAPLPAHTIGK